ncbi:RNA polymerase sigma factor RpoD/SigA [Marinobacter sp.]|uniref:sigma-70 family RNA polymerase sigma factor n=1 Tax=Marinobacter sp. TaxID=50741 RepID=UPI0035667D06
MRHDSLNDLSESLVSRYFRDVSGHDLLTPAQEQRLSARLSRVFGRLSDLTGCSVPATIREARDCYAGLPTGNHGRRLRALLEGCRDRLIRSNLRLAVHIARRHDYTGMAMGDLIQEANIGLIKAVDRFDPARGFRFSTYAYWWITEEVRRAQKRGQRVVRAPDHVIDEIRQLQAVTMRLHHRLARQPRQSELAREMEVDPSRISEIRGYAATELSTELTLGEGSDTSLGETLADERFDPATLVQGNDHKRTLGALMDHLNHREKEVLTRRFGLGMDSEHTLQVISDDLGISRERVRQIEKGAIRKLQELTFSRSINHPMGEGTSSQ